MRIFRFIILLVGVTLLLNSGEYVVKKDNGVNKISDEKRLQVVESYGRLPLSFIRNDGQVDEKVKYYERGRGRTTFFTEDGVYIVLSRTKDENKTKDKFERMRDRLDDIDAKKEIETEYVVIKPYNADKGVEIETEGELSGRVNYFIGNDPNKWRTDIPTYSKVRYKKIYKGIDLVFYGNQRELEYDVVVGPEGDLSKVAFLVEGASKVRSIEEGLEIELANGGRIVQKLPHIYQEIEGKKVEVSGRFDVKKTKNGEYLFGFDISDYDRRYALIIDPVVLSYSTYLGGSGADYGSGIAVDTQGNVYVTGNTNSTDFPTKNPYQANGYGNYLYDDVFITKLSSDGRNLIYSTYLGGIKDDESYGIAVDTQGNVYVTGMTKSTDFPTKNPYQANINGGDWYDVFVTKLSFDGQSLIYSTYLGGGSNDEGKGIAVDSQGNAYVTGMTNSTNFPTKTPCQANMAGDWDVFITKISSNGQSLIYSTYLGGGGSDGGYGIAVDSQGNAYVTGRTFSTNFQTKNPYQANNGGYSDAFISKLSSDGQSLIYSTYLGGNGDDEGYGIAVDTQGNAYVTGDALSTNFPTENPYQVMRDFASGDVFITKLSSDGQSLIYSTYLGGSDEDIGYGIAVDTQGNAYVTGTTRSPNFPTKNPYQSFIRDYDVFVTKLSFDGQSLIYSTYLGGGSNDEGKGIAVDIEGNAYVTGYTESSSFPTKNPYQTNKGANDVFITKINGVLINKIKVSKVGQGSGIVTSNPSGINCGNDCTEEYSEVITLILTAMPTNSSVFSGWGEDCSVCGENSECQITMDSDKTCTVEFRKSEITDAGTDAYDVLDASEDITTDVVVTDSATIDVGGDVSTDIISEDIKDVDTKDILSDTTTGKDIYPVDIEQKENDKEMEKDIYACSCNLLE